MGKRSEPNKAPPPSPPTPPSTASVLAEYVALREGGTDAAHTFHKIEASVEQIEFEQRVQLAAQIKAWEAAEATKNRKPAPPPTAQSPSPPTTSAYPLPAAAAPGGSTPSSPFEPSSAPSTPPAAPAGEQVACPNCGKLNQPNSAYCYSCGYILRLRSTQTRAFQTSELEDPGSNDDAYFGRFSQFYLHIAGSTQPIEVMPGQEVIIGRVTSDSALSPDIDLTPYDAENLGVSRLHASLKWLDNTILLTDMNSSNHTYINGKRLNPHEVRALRDGDDIRLGRLGIQVSFKQRLRRL